MADEEYITLSAEDQDAAIGVATTESGKPAYLLEKDVWVVWALAALFDSPFAEHLVFKGGTSLSKAYKVIDQFSEDIDITYDIRVLLSDLVGNAEDALPPTASQGHKWTKAAKQRLAKLVAVEVLPFIKERLAASNTRATATAKEDCIYIAYEAVAKGYDYVAPTVKIEFGARSTGDPHEVHEITCDAAPHLPDLTFPKASPHVMRAERTFWEKATAVHVYCRGGKLTGEAIARHWYDLKCLDDAKIAGAALRDRELALRVARHKDLFFREKDGTGKRIDYVEAVSGGLVLVPAGEALERLRRDYEKMVGDGLLQRSADEFDRVMEICGQIAKRANKAPA